MPDQTRELQLNALWIRHRRFGCCILGFVAAAAVSICAAREGEVPPPLLGADGNYEHPTDVRTAIISLSPTGLILECTKDKTPEHPARVWRERYAIRDGRLFLAAIVTQRFIPPQPAHTVWQETPLPESYAVAQQIVTRDNPLTGFQKSQGSNAYVTAVGPKPENQQAVPDHLDGAKEGPAVASFSLGMPQIDPKHPRSRQVSEQHVRPPVYAETKLGISNLGVTSLDPGWTNFGVYVKRLCETVQIEWDSILDETRPVVAAGKTVSVTFVLNSKGQITRVLKIEPSAGISDAGARACASAITNRSPYGPWSDDMIAVLGTEQTITFTFLYE